ncbi:mast/stem cell growth factor receptor Kit-like [Diprion similis]|uniref:mast/stem cell growth factor receptor Kit-like n=1 Tax=Diprion similis TaxID=362088 RepID=UPI001EF983DC|nr:mast/stem cell growth factor receptor Kit-like [Diprion similis]
MDRMKFTCVIICGIFGLFDQGVAAGKPNMYPTEDEIIIQEGAELKISCSGVSTIHFSAMNISGIKASLSRTEIDKSSGVCTFIVPNMRRTDAGWYACAEEGIQIQNDEQTVEHPTENISWIYVYVNSSDPFAGYFPPVGKTIKRPISSSLVIPCRPTLRHMQIPILLKVEQVVDLSREGFRFDPKIGFIKDNVNESSTIEYTCISSPLEGGVAGEVVVIVKIEKMTMAPPIIDEDKLRHLVWGQNHTFSCHITNTTHKPGIDIYQLTWEAPDSIPEERLRRKNLTGTEVVLTILDVQKSDSGKYTCILEGRSHINPTSKSVDIKFYDPHAAYINVTAISPSTQTVNATQTAVWEVDIDTYPEANITWLDTEGTRISNSTEYSHHVSGTNHKFQIHNVKIADFGNYTIRIDYGNETKDHLLELKVRAPPTAEIEALYLSHKRNKVREFLCRISGYPLPNVTWRYSEFADLESDNKSVYTVLPPTRNESLDNPLAGFRSFLKISINATGNLTCRSCNEIHCAESIKKIHVDGNYPTAEASSHKDIIWISSICILITIIIVVIICMGVRMNREKRRIMELLDAGLTHFEDGALECLNPDLTVGEQAELLPYDKKWEFPREDLKLGKQLGSGAFGVVMKAEARGICVAGEITTVAVKMVRRSVDPSYMKALSGELKILIHLGRHLNVVNLLGACTKTILTKRELYVIVEYCRFGNLNNYLQRHRASFIDQIDPSTKKFNPNIGMEFLVGSESICSQNRFNCTELFRSISTQSSSSNSGTSRVDYRQSMHFDDVNMSPDGAILSNNSVQPGWRSNYRGDYKDQNLNPVCTRDLLSWAWQVSRGMEYLSSRNVLHGDLAARNILLADDNVVKICDFGLAKNMYNDKNYTKKEDCLLPVKWMAIESIRDRIFSTQSDVWSFGIVLWEFFTLARTPYPSMGAKEQYDQLTDGYRMEKPEYATEEIYDIILNCWKEKPNLRPSFSELVENIGTLLDEDLKIHYANLNFPYENVNIETSRNRESDYLIMMSAPNHSHHISPNLALEVSSHSDYLPMTAVNKSGQGTTYGIRPELHKPRSEFPSPKEDALYNSDSGICIEPKLKLENETSLKPPITNLHKRYCNIPNVLQNQSSVNDKISNDILHVSKNITNNLPSFLHGNQNEYVNTLPLNIDTANDKANSCRNSSYVIVPTTNIDEQFAQQLT